MTDDWLYPVTYFALDAVMSFNDRMTNIELAKQHKARREDNSDIAIANERLKTIDTAIKVDINDL